MKNKIIFIYWSIFILLFLSMIELSFISAEPYISIIYPENVTYNINVSDFNYTTDSFNYTNDGLNCSFSSDNGITNYSAMGSEFLGVGQYRKFCANLTNVASNEGSNTWTIYIKNDTSGNTNSSSVTFFKDTVFPAIKQISPQNEVYLTNSDINFSWVINDSNGISNTTIYLCASRVHGMGGGTESNCGNNGWDELINQTFINSSELSDIFNDSLEVSMQLIDDNYYWYVNVFDLANNFNVTDYNYFYIDTTITPSTTSYSVYDIMNSAGAGLGSFMIYTSQGLFGFLMILGLIAVFTIIGYAVAMAIIESVKNSRR